LTISINGGATYTTSTSVTLTLSATNAYECAYSNDNSAWSGWESYGTSRSWSLTTGDGTKTVYYNCRNTLGTESGATSDSIVLDTTAPSITITSPTAGSRVSGVVTITFTGYVATPMVSIDGAAYVAAASGSYSWDTTAVTDGTHTIQARGTDDAGLTGYSNVVSVEVDNKVPFGYLRVDRNYTRNNDTITFTYQADDIDYNVTVNTSTIDSNSTIVTLTDPDDDAIYNATYRISHNSTLADGSKTITVNITEELAYSYTKTTTVVLDNTEPGAPNISSNFTENLPENYNDPWFSWNSSDNYGIQSYEFILEKDNATVYSSENESRNTTYQNLTNGEYILKVRAKDLAGNYGNYSNYTIDVQVLEYGLVEGWNLLSISVDTGGMNAQDILDLIPEGIQITTWNSTAKKYVSHVDGFSPNNFAILKGDAYWIKVSANATWNFGGYEYAAENMSLYSGWNLISWMNTSTKGAQDVLDSIGDSAVMIAYYNTTLQEYVLYVDELGGVRNFSVNNLMGYWIYLSENVSPWKPASIALGGGSTPTLPSNAIFGFIRQNEEPEAGVRVTIRRGSDERSTLTESSGGYIFESNYSEGDTIEIIASKGGFTTSTTEAVGSGPYQRIDMELNEFNYNTVTDFIAEQPKEISIAEVDTNLEIITAGNIENAEISVQLSYTEPEEFPDKAIKTITLSSDKTLDTSSIALSIGYTPNEIAGINENSLAVYRNNGQEWERLSDSGVNVSANYVWAILPEFGEYAIGGESASEEITINLVEGWNLFSIPFE